MNHKVVGGVSCQPAEATEARLQRVNRTSTIDPVSTISSVGRAGGCPAETGGPENAKRRICGKHSRLALSIASGRNMRDAACSVDRLEKLGFEACCRARSTYTLVSLTG